MMNDYRDETNPLDDTCDYSNDTNNIYQNSNSNDV